MVVQIIVFLRAKTDMSPRLWLLGILWLFLLPSCNVVEQHNAQLFYTKVYLINDSLDNLTLQWHIKLQEGIANRNFTTLYNDRTNLSVFLVNSRSNIANMRNTDNNEPLKNAIDRLLANQIAIASDVYPQFEQFSAYTPQELIDKALDQLGDDLPNQQRTSMQIRKDLQLYMLKYGLKNKRK